MDLNPDTMFFSDGASANGVWQDSSSANNDMTLASGPTYESDGSSTLNGHAVVRFDATDDSGMSGLNLTKPYTIYIIEKGASAGSVRTINSNTANNLISMGRDGLQCNLSTGVPYSSLASNVGTHVMGVLVVPSSGSASFFKNGVDVTWTGGSAAAVDWGTVSIGADGVFDEAPNSDVARILIYLQIMTPQTALLLNLTLTLTTDYD